jgi:hypothetical protein
MNPFPQSADVWHPAARADGAAAIRAANAPTETKILLSDMGRTPFLKWNEKDDLPQ